MDKDKIIKTLKKADSLKQGGDLALAKEFISIENQVNTVTEKANKIAEIVDAKLSEISEELKKKEWDITYEVDEEKIAENVLSKIPTPKDGEDGKDYILTDQDKKDIAKSIKVPVVEKVIEKTEVIRETPIITNEIKEVAKYEEAEDIKNKLESLKDDERLDASAIKNLPEGLSGAKGRLVRVTTDSTLTGDGTPSNPLHAVNDATAEWGSVTGDINNQTDLIEKFEDYAKLAIEITHDAFQALYVSSTLIPNQWYLITDYTTYRFIVGDTNTYYRGPVEPIYVQALDVNKVNPEGHSKAFPDEIIYYKAAQSITSKSFNTSANLNEGVASGNFVMSVLNPTTIDLSDAPYPANQGTNQFFQIKDITSGAYFYFTDSNIGVDWDFDEDGNFRLLTTNYNADIWSDAFWNTNDGSVGSIPMIVEGNDEIALDGDRFDNYLWDVDRGAGGSLYDDDIGQSLYFDFVNKGHIWDIDPTSGNIIFTNTGADVYANIEFDGVDNYGDYTVEVSDSSTFWIDWSAVNSPGTFYNGTTGVDIYWSDETTTTLSWDNFGIDWKVSGNEVTLIGNSHDLTSDLVSISGTMFGNSTSDILQIIDSSYGEASISLVKSVLVELDLENPVNIYFSYNYTVPVNGYIYARYNVPKNFYFDLDYRGRLIRRYALQNVGDWVSGTTYTYNQVVTKNGYYFLCFATSTTADVTNNSVWFPIGEVGNYYGATNLNAYSGSQVSYNSNVYSDIQPFNVSAFNSATKTMNASIRNSVGSSTDLNVLILNFNDNSFYESDIFVQGWLLSRTFFRSTTGLFINSIVGGVTSSTAAYINGSILPMLSICNINQISGVFSQLSSSQLGVVAGVIAQRITSSKLVDVTNALFAQGCVGSTINVCHSFYCEQSFNGNNILNSNTTSFTSVKLLNIPGYLASFNGNIITSNFQNVAIQARGFISDNKIYNTFQNVDWYLNAVQGSVFNGSVLNSQINNSETSIAACGFQANANILSGNQPISFSTIGFTGTASLVFGNDIFSYTGVTTPPVAGDRVKYPYRHINIAGVSGTENACVIKAVYHNSATGSGQIVLGTKRLPNTSGTLIRDGGSVFDTNITYTSVTKGFSTGFTTVSTPIPAIGDVYQSSSGELFYYSGFDDKHQMVGPRTLSSETLTRVTGSGSATLIIASPANKISSITSSFFPSSITAQIGTFGSGRILNSIFGTIISNNTSFQSCVVQNFNQQFELPVIVTGPYTHQLNRKSLTTTYTTSLQDDCLDCNGTFTVNLLSSATLDGKTFQFKNTGTGNITIDPFSTQTIEGAATLTLYPGEAVIIQSDNVNWNIITEGGGVPYTGAVKDVDLGNNNLIASYVYELGTYGRIYRRLFSVSTVTITTATVTKIEEFDTDGEASNVEVSNNYDNITIQKDGKYQISFTAAFKSDVDNIDFNYSLFVNGTEVELGNTITTDAKGWRTASFDGIARLEKDDVLDVRIIQNSGGDIDLSMKNLDFNVSYLGE